MKHFKSIQSTSINGSVLTIGAFDGVHLGHQKILRAMRDGQPTDQHPLAVLTFFPHPNVVLHGRRPSFYLTTPEEKADLLAEHGVDVVITETFDETLSRVSAEDFVRRLVKHLGLHSLWVGPDFALGYEREGNLTYLRKKGLELGFEVHVVEPLKMNGEVVSSTRIREALRSGDVARAAGYLGRPFELVGEVIHGSGRGRELGIPTANLSIWSERAYPRKGVYACFVKILGEKYSAVANVGDRPTFEEDKLPKPIVEAHLLDFGDHNIYGETLRLQFIRRLRDEQEFNGSGALLDQIQLDIKRARQILEEQ
ncbi:MAG: bifunctional riboflavin kinase/FAD synthetase [Anaerolineales bacterium]